MLRYQSILLLCLAAALGTPAAAEPAANPQLRELQPGKFASGTLILKMKGNEYEFFTTSQKLGTNLAANIDDPAAKAFAEKMSGKTVDTAVLRLIGGTLYVSLGVSLHTDPAKPTPKEILGAGFSVEFSLDPKTLRLKDVASLRFSPPGSTSSQMQQTSTCTLTLESIAKNPDGSLAMTGTFSGTLDKDLTDNPLAKPETISGSFHILRATGNDLVLPLLKGQ